jgi:hypothetical protein
MQRVETSRGMLHQASSSLPWDSIEGTLFGFDAAAASDTKHQQRSRHARKLASWHSPVDRLTLASTSFRGRSPGIHSHD